MVYDENTLDLSVSHPNPRLSWYLNKIMLIKQEGFCLEHDKYSVNNSWLIWLIRKKTFQLKVQWKIYPLGVKSSVNSQIKTTVYAFV